MLSIIGQFEARLIISIYCQDYYPFDYCHPASIISDKCESCKICVILFPAFYWKLPRKMNRRRTILLSLLVASSLVLMGISKQANFAAASQLSSSFSQAVARGIGLQKRRPRVGIQIGHYKAIEQPEELKNIRYSTGGQVKDITEVATNKSVAIMLKEMLNARGIDADILPATIPPNYRADVFISIHADASPNPKRRGYKSAYFMPDRNDWDKMLKKLVDESYFYFMGLPDDDNNVSGDMLEYYAFNKRFKHSISKKTPGLIVEIGYISNKDDLAAIKDPVNPAYALKVGIVKYLQARKLID